MDNHKIHVFDTTLRDGEQVPGCQLNTKEKVMNSDSLIYSLMTDSKFNLPKVLPDNKYAGFDIKLSN